MITKFSPHRILKKRQQGQTLTEFAMVLPLLALLLFGIIQFGIVFHQYVTLTDSVRAGGRQGAVSRDLANPQAVVIDRVRRSAADLNPGKLGVTVSSTLVQGSDVAVTATYPYDISLLGVVGKSGTLRASTTERVE